MKGAPYLVPQLMQMTCLTPDVAARMLFVIENVFHRQCGAPDIHVRRQGLKKLRVHVSCLISRIFFKRENVA